jgi:hypothetical protein
MILVSATGLHLRAPRLGDILRWIHIIGGIFIGTFVYSPWGTEPAFIAIMQFVVMPVLIMTGIAMW